MKPTSEQQTAIDLYRGGDSLLIRAFAGTGKTSTLKWMADATDRSGHYLAFNKSIADEASRDFPSRIDCRTIHSHAYRRMTGAFSQEKLNSKFNLNVVRERLSVGEFEHDDLFQTDAQIASLVRDTVQAFCQSADTHIRKRHVPKRARLKLCSRAELAMLRSRVMDIANHLWRIMIDPPDSMPLGHDGYLKLWALSNPEFRSDVIFLDEAQDTNPVVLGLLERHECQLVCVGDDYQQIYEWRGAINAMDSMKCKNKAALTHSFRFGENIANRANEVLELFGESERLKGIGPTAPRSKNGPIAAHLCRTNAGVIRSVLELLDKSARISVIGGTSEISRLLDGVERLMNGKPSGAPEFYGFQNWKEVEDYADSEDGSELRMLVDLVRKHGVPELRRAISGANCREEQSEIVIGTTHKAKGRQWDSVVLVEDFFPPFTFNGRLIKAEARLLYVAVTRAKRELTVTDGLFESIEKWKALRFDTKKDWGNVAAKAVEEVRKLPDSVRSSFNLAVQKAPAAHNKDNAEKSAAEIKQLSDRAAAGETDSQRELALWYYLGRGVEQSLERAFYWYRMAADAGDPEAAFQAGMMLRSGEGVEESDERGFDYYQLAAKSGHTQAQKALYSMYRLGDFVKRDLKEAERWLRMAAGQGDPEAANELRQLQTIQVQLLDCGP